MRRPATTALAVGLLLCAGAAASAVVGPAQPAGDGARPRPAAVARAGAVCPEPLAATGATTQVALAAPGLPDEPAAGLPDEPAAGLPDEPAAGGAAVLAPVGQGGPALVSLRTAGTAAAAAASADGPALVGSARGSLAPGLTAGETTLVPSGDLRGLAGTVCVPAGTDFWFVGSGAEVGQRGRLYLTNPESAPAQVDVTLYGPAGEIDAPAGRGVAVAAGGQEVLLLDALAPAVARFGVHVEVRSGRVAAALRDQQIRGLDPLGVDWVPVTAAPSRRVVLPGVPPGPGERRLQVLAPGTDDAIVRLRLLAADGSFVPAGLDVVEVAAGEVGDVDLAPYARGEAVAVELVSDTPVTAGLLVRAGSAEEQPEIAYVAAGEPLTADRPGTLAAAGAGTAAATLVLAAPGRAADVELTPLSATGAAGSPTTVDVAEGAQVEVALADLATEPVAGVVVRPASGSGPVVAGRVLAATDARGPLLTVQAVPAGRYVVRVPPVVADLSTGLRDPG